MKIIAFIEARQGDTIRKILEHCGLWHDPPPRAPPKALPPSQTVRSITLPASDPGITHEIDPDFLEHLRREASDLPLIHDAALPLLNAKRSSCVKGQPEPLTRRYGLCPPAKRGRKATAACQGELPWEA